MMEKGSESQVTPGYESAQGWTRVFLFCRLYLTSGLLCARNYSSFCGFYTSLCHLLVYFQSQTEKLFFPTSFKIYF